MELLLWIENLSNVKKQVINQTTLHKADHVVFHLWSDILCVLCPGPTFVVQYLFDQAQLVLFNIDLNGQPISESQWNYIQDMGLESRSTLHHVS